MQRLEQAQAANRELQQQVAASEGRSEELVAGLKVGTPLYARSQTGEGAMLQLSGLHKYGMLLTASQRS